MGAHIARPIAADDDVAHAVDASGAVKLTLALGAEPGAPALAADGTLYIGTGDGNLEAIGP